MARRERRDGGARELAFLIGGPDGHGAAALDAAKLKLSLGPMTLPHGLARIVLVEQLYRAMQRSSQAIPIIARERARAPCAAGARCLPLRNAFRS